MKPIFYFVSFVGLSTLISCGGETGYQASSNFNSTDISYLEPQPLHKENINKFPNVYQGSYFNSNDSSMIEITKTALIMREESSSDEADTVFNLEKNDELRKYKDYLFLNHLNEDHQWKIKVIKKRNKSLMIDHLVNGTEVDSVMATPGMYSKDSTDKELLSPDKKSLTNHLKRKVFFPEYEKQD